MEFETVAKIVIMVIVVIALFFIVKEINVLKEIFLNWFNVG
ncbi:MAG: hypothetical protein Q8R00_03670 [Candidatus Nanoarchaeia archaeon]|nr:hypothetical protein [Candidatus Nanoarchaeia archaeon]